MASTKEPAREYARLLLRHHELDPRGENELPELDAICLEMDVWWGLMNGRERRRMKGLSQDLYALADGRRGVPMRGEEIARWSRQGATAHDSQDPDILLTHLRQPYPPGFPAGLIPFLQGHAWERLGILEVAVVFFLDAGKVLPPVRMKAISCLRLLGRAQEAGEAARRILDDSQSRRPEIYLAVTELFLMATTLEPEGPRRVFESLVDPLRRVIAEERRTQIDHRENPKLEQMAARALAFTLALLDRRGEVREVCTDALARYPDDPALHLARGMVNLAEDPTAAESDYEKAIAAGIRDALPYVVIAWFRVQRGNYADAFSLCSQALQFQGMAPLTKAWLFEVRGIALAELKQPLVNVEEEFARAVALDPVNAGRIEHNRRVAIDALQGKTTAGGRENWTIPALHPVLEDLRSNLFRNLVSQQEGGRGENYSDLLAAKA